MPVGFDVADGIKWYIVFLVSTSLHEASHAWVAFKLGDPTAAAKGLATVAPSPHIKRSPMGMVAVPLVSFALNGWMIGWASVPFDINWALKYPRRAAAMALAGPLANITLVLLAVALMRLGVEWGLLQGNPSPGFMNVVFPVDRSEGLGLFAAKFLSLFFSLNLLLAAFNLLPLPPLDGSSLPMLALPSGLARKYAEAIRQPTFALFGIILAWNMFGPIFRPLFRQAANLLYFLLGPR